MKKGDKIPYLDWTLLTTDIHADTNFKFACELFNAGAKFYCPQEYDVRSYLPVSINPVRGLNALLKQENGLLAKPYLHLQTFAYHLNAIMMDYKEKERIEKIRGGEAPRSIENVPISQSTRHDVMTKIAIIRIFQEMFDWKAINRYDKHITEELNFARDYMGIKESELIKLQKLFKKLLVLNVPRRSN